MTPQQTNEYNERVEPKLLTEGSGTTTPVRHKDLFEDYTNMPNELSGIFHKWSERIEDGLNYASITELHNEVYAIGYTFDSGLDAVPYGLRKIGIELNELEGWEE